MKIAVKVLPRDEVLDMQGRTVSTILADNGFSVTELRVGKYFELEIPLDAQPAMKEAQRVAEEWLCNPLTEKFAITAVES